MQPCLWTECILESPWNGVFWALENPVIWPSQVLDNKPWQTVSTKSDEVKRLAAVKVDRRTNGRRQEIPRNHRSTANRTVQLPVSIRRSTASATTEAAAATSTEPSTRACTHTTNPKVQQSEKTAPVRYHFAKTAHINGICTMPRKTQHTHRHYCTE